MNFRRPTAAWTAAALLSSALAAPAGAQVVVSGNVDYRTTPPPNLFRDDPNITSDTHTVLFQEQSGLLLGQDLWVDISDDGHFGGLTGAGWGSGIEGSIPSGTEVDVYILCFDDVSSGKHASSGTVVFPAPILGIHRKERSFKAQGSNAIYGGDALLGHPQVKYPGHPDDPNGQPHQDRGLEPGQSFNDNGTQHKEELHWHADDRTLSFDFIVNNRPDHVRIVTEKASAGPGDPTQIFCIGDSGCPCFNDTPAAEQAGCANSTGGGAKLRGAGSASAAADDLTLSLSGLPANRFAIVFFGPTIEATPSVFGDGLRCVSPGPPGDGQGGGFLRLPIQHSGGAGFVQYSGLVGQFPAQLLPGSTWGFQGFYRDPANASCTDAGFNLSNGLAVTFQ